MRVVVLVCLLALLAGIARAEPARVETGYRSGRKIKLRVVAIDSSEVEVKTARAYQRMREAAAKAGVTLLIRSGFRSHDRQALLYMAWREGWGNRAARPGWSNHQSGRALDLVVDEEATFHWLTKHARRYGFRRTVRSEPWHWEYFPGRRKTRTAKR